MAVWYSCSNMTNPNDLMPLPVLVLGIQRGCSDLSLAETIMSIISATDPEPGELGAHSGTLCTSVRARGSRFAKSSNVRSLHHCQLAKCQIYRRNVSQATSRRSAPRLCLEIHHPGPSSATQSSIRQTLSRSVPQWRNGRYEMTGRFGSPKRG